jgi:hypothetical protein
LIQLNLLWLDVTDTGAEGYLESVSIFCSQ